MTLTPALANAITARSAALDGFDNRLLRSLIATFEDLVGELEKELAVLDLDTGSRTFQRARARALLGQARKQISQAYARIGEQMEVRLATAAADELVEAANYINLALAPLANAAPAVNTVALSPDVLRQIARNTVVNMGDTWGAQPMVEWLKTQERDVVDRIARQLNQSILRGEGTRSQMARLRRNVLDTERRTLEALARTGTQSVVSQARQRVYRQNRRSLQGIYQLSTADDRTTEVCLAYANRAWYWDESGNEVPYQHSMPYNGGIPRHPNCRSVDMPWVKSLADMGVDTKKVSPKLGRLFNGGPPDTVTGQTMLKKAQSENRRLLSRFKTEQWERGNLKVRDLIKKNGAVRTDKEIRTLLRGRGVL